MMIRLSTGLQKCKVNKLTDAFKRSFGGSVASKADKKQQSIVFDRDLKLRQRNWSLSIDESDYYDYLRKECAERLIDRLEDINRSFPLALEIGSHRGHLYSIINSRQGLNGKGGVGGIEELVQCDTSPLAVEYTERAYQTLQKEPLTLSSSMILDDENKFPFEPASFDLVLSSMNMHWVNNLPGLLSEIKNVMKPDGCFVGCMLGGTTLKELRECFYLAEQERRGRLSPHASPFALASDVAALMQAAGFSLPTIDVDEITIGYPDAITLMKHLQKMGESSASLNRQLTVGKDTFLATAALYQEMYGQPDGTVPATFQVIYMIGWAPHDSQPKPCRRGSHTHSIKDISNVKTNNVRVDSSSKKT